MNKLDGLLFLLLVLVIIITLVVAGLAVTNRIIFKMAARNFARRKAQSVIVILGLMIGTSIISSALVVRDTMTNNFEVSTYRSLGELDEDIWGINAFGTVTYFSEDLYDKVSSSISSLPEIDGVVPVISEQVSIFNFNSQLGEPSANILGFNSQLMRNTPFGDLDGDGYYTDSQSAGEVAINSRLADEIEAKVGDVIRLSFGLKDTNSQFGLMQGNKNFTITKIIQETKLYGKANYNQDRTAFFELDLLQNLLNRPGEINHIWVSNKGDYREGEKYTEDVNTTIEEALDEAIGMADAGFVFESFEDNLVLMNTKGYFPLQQAGSYLAIAEEYQTTITKGVVLMTMAVNGIPTQGYFVMGGESDIKDFPDNPLNSILVPTNQAAKFNLTNNSTVSVTTISIDGSIHNSNLQVILLPPNFQQPIPYEMQPFNLGFVDFETSQLLLHGGAYPDKMISLIMLSGLDNSTLNTIQTETKIRMDKEIGGEALNLEVHNVKANNLESARAGGQSLGDLFMIFGIFSIIAGIVLIINIFVMLGEERKSEMGMARAVGMKTKHLIRMYLFEGTLYAFFAAAVGALLGLFFGWLVIISFEYIFGELAEVTGSGFDIPFYFSWDSVLTAFCAGLLITFITIFFTSRRISRLNLIRAIRRIPEPQSPRAKGVVLLYGGLLIIIGFILTPFAIASDLGGFWLAAAPCAILGFALIAHRWVSIRGAMTGAGLAIIIFIFLPFEIPVVSDLNYNGLDAFVLSGVFSVLGAVLIVMFNSDYILSGVQKVFAHGRTTRAVLKTAISYPMASKFKTGMTLAMFALIIFTVTVIAMIASMQASTADTMLEQQSGDYDIFGFTNARTPFVNLSKDNLSEELKDVDIEELEVVSMAIVNIVELEREGGDSSVAGDPTVTIERYQLLGVSDSFMAENGFTLNERDSKFSSDRETWEALGQNSSYCIVDGTKLAYSGITVGGPPMDYGGVYVGGHITITDLMGQNKTRELTVIGVTDQMYFINGIFVKQDTVRKEYGGVDSLVMIKLGPGEDADVVAKKFERSYLENGLQTFDLKGIINTILTLSNNIMYLMEGFLGIGLLVGIAGIGIISYRNVIERRQQIGMLRAIGFKKNMVAKSFLIETSFITLLAILLGLCLGIGIGWQIYTGSEFQEMGAKFVIPWGNLLAIIIIAYITTLIFTFYPSIKASKVPPAEALRYIE